MSSTMWAVLLFPLVAWVFYVPGRFIARHLWRKLPEGRLKRLLFKDVSKWANPPAGVKRWDQ